MIFHNLLLATTGLILLLHSKKSCKVSRVHHTKFIAALTPWVLGVSYPLENRFSWQILKKCYVTRQDPLMVHTGVYNLDSSLQTKLATPPCPKYLGDSLKCTLPTRIIWLSGNDLIKFQEKIGEDDWWKVEKQIVKIFAAVQSDSLLN